MPRLSGIFQDADSILLANIQDASVAGRTLLGAADAAAQRTALGVLSANQKTVNAAGTVYGLTATPAALDFGTTDPAITLDAAGTYLLLARARADYNAATFAASRLATLKLRRTNNTAADVSNGSVALKTDIITAITSSLGALAWWALYTTANVDDIITIFGDVSVLPTAGSLDISEASIIAIRLQS